MNERIRQLALQADGVFIHNVMTGAKQYTFLEKDLEKFAELIVKECLDQITSGPDPAYYATEAVVRIRKHFGIP